VNRSSSSQRPYWHRLTGRGASGIVRGLAACGVLTLTGLAAAVVWCQTGLATATRLARHGLWAEVHAPLGRYLRIHPDDAAANLLCAEALVKDDAQPLLRRITESIERLERIPDDAPEALAARVATARIQLFLRYEPTAAWNSLQRALALDPDALEAHLLAIRLLELIGRLDDTEDLFWRVYELTPRENRPLRLRDWYASQFFPLSSLGELDTLMGFRQSPSDPIDLVEGRRLQRFVKAEPAAPWPNAALARWFLGRAEPDVARELLDVAAERMTERDRTDPFFLGTKIDVLCDLGEAEAAADAFATWPDGDRRRRYHLARGRVLQEANDDPGAAVAAFDAALAIWPGPVDWRTVSRSATCLTRAGEEDRASLRRDAAKRIEKLMDEPFHKSLFTRLANLEDRSALADAEAFYRGLGRVREADGWAAAAAALPPPGATDGTGPNAGNPPE